jgi:two-component system, NtrC family, sensor kinase
MAIWNDLIVVDEDVLKGATQQALLPINSPLQSYALKNGLPNLEDLPSVPALVISSRLSDLEKASEIYHGCIKIWYVDRAHIPTQIELVSAVNELRVFAIPSRPELLNEDVKRALASHGRWLNLEARKQKFRDQNIQLNSLTQDLEETVSERTRVAEERRVEARDRVRSLRRLVAYCEQLVDLTSVDRFVDLIRQEVRQFGLSQPPILSVLDWDNSPKKYWYQGQMLTARKANFRWSDRLAVRFNDREDIEYLRAEFGRPFLKIVSIPLRSSVQKRLQSAMAPTLFFEHDMSDEKAESLLKFLAPRLEPAALALERLILDLRLERTATLWATTFSAFRDPLAIISSDYKIEMANAQFEANGVGGVTAGSIELKSWPQRPDSFCYQVLFDRDSPCENCPLDKAFQSGLPQQAQIGMIDKTFQLNSYPIRIGDESRPTSMVHHYRDVKEERDLQGRMIQNEKMAEIGRLAGHIAHELNNPLTGIRSMAQLILANLKSELNPSSELLKSQFTTLFADMSEVESAAERSQKIIENLLDFAAGSSSGSPRKEVDIDLNELILKTVPMLKTVIHEHQNEIYLTPEVLTVRVEPQLIQQVIFNIINNACQAMTEPGRIELRTWRESLENIPWAVFEVKDTGPGIPMHIQKRVFEPFFTTKEPGRGTGLGLSLSKKIVEGFGGKIEIQNGENGRGAWFKISLPASQTQIRASK